MEIRRPNPEPRGTGDFDVYVNPVAYGKPYASIKLDEAGSLRLDSINLDDARRLAKAAARIEQELTAAHARMAAPHGRKNFYQGTCQLCGKPEADELHAEPDPPGCICDIASADQCPVHRSEPAAAPELTVRERAQRGARKAAEREAAGKGGVLIPAGDEDEAETAGPPYASEGIDGLRWDNMSSSGSAS